MSLGTLSRIYFPPGDKKSMSPKLLRLTITYATVLSETFVNIVETLFPKLKKMPWVAA